MAHNMRFDRKFCVQENWTFEVDAEIGAENRDPHGGQRLCIETTVLGHTLEPVLDKVCRIVHHAQMTVGIDLEKSWFVLGAKHYGSQVVLHIGP